VVHVKTQMWSIVGSVEWRIGHRCSSAPEAMIKAVSNAPGNKHIRIEETRTSMRIANHDNRLVFLRRRENGRELGIDVEHAPPVPRPHQHPTRPLIPAPIAGGQPRHIGGQHNRVG